MRLFSTALAHFTFDERLPPAPPPLLAGLPDSELNLYFERFAYFLYQSPLVSSTPTSTISLPQAMYDNFVAKLIDTSGPAPLVVSDTFNYTSASITDNRKLKLSQTGSSTLNLCELITKKYLQLKSISAQQAYDFQLYMYIALNHFAIWYCEEVYKELSGGGYRLAPLIRDYLASYITFQWGSARPSLSQSWFGESWFLDGCKLRANTFQMLSALKSKFSSLGAAKQLTATKRLTELFRAGLAVMVDADVRSIVSRLTVTTPTPDSTLADGYGQFNMLGAGDGGQTTGLFGIPDYGTLFFNYSIVITRNIITTEKIRQASFELDPEGKRGVTFFYFGLEPDLNAKPWIELTAEDNLGMPVGSPQQVRVTAISLDHRFSSKGLVDPSGVSANSFQPAKPVCLSAKLSTASGEEMEFISFEHRMGDRPPLHPPISLQAEWTFPDNGFSSADAIGPAPFSDPASQASLATLVSQMVQAPASPALDLEAFIVGRGVGEPIKDPNSPGCDLGRTASQADTSIPDAAYGARRYAYGRVYWSLDTNMLWFTSEGFVSPLRCTWDAHLVPLGTRTLQGEFGNYLPDDGGQPSYNCVLSAFRAFSLCEAMMQALMDKTADMALSNVIPVAAANALTAKIIAYRNQTAVGFITLPNGDRPRRKNPAGEVFVTYDLFHAFQLQ